MIGEYWAGWFDHWGNQHAGSNVQGNVRDIEWCLKNGVSFNLYMFHGGTNFGFMQGANGGSNDYGVDVTSYDYDSALNESGRVTPKYTAFRNAIAGLVAEKLPPVPSMPEPIAIAKTTLTQSITLRSMGVGLVSSARPLTFEDMDQAHGIVIYKTYTNKFGRGDLTIDKLGDYATVFVGGVRQGTIDRRKQQKSLKIEIPAPGATIEIVVESLSRVNFGGLIPTERKGIDGRVRFGGEELTSWNQFLLPLNEPPRRLRPVDAAAKEPVWYFGSLDVPNPGDTFLDMRNFTKGFVWVNGHNLGRFWRIGPQQTLYLPGVWLRKGKNDIVLLEDSGKVEKPVVEGLTAPILDEVEIDYSKLNRKPGQKLDLAGVAPIQTGSLPQATGPITVAVSGEGRYLCLEALSSHGDDQWTSLAELWLLDENGHEIPRTGWKVLYADSEEINGEDGSASNVFDLQPTTIWHTQWQGKAPSHPHALVIDLGANVKVSGIKLLARQSGTNGRIKDYRLYLSKTPFRGL